MMLIDLIIEKGQSNDVRLTMLQQKLKCFNNENLKALCVSFSLMAISSIDLILCNY
jgi:hypothetical protein